MFCSSAKGVKHAGVTPLVMYVVICSCERSESCTFLNICVHGI